MRSTRILAECLTDQCTRRSCEEQIGRLLEDVCNHDETQIEALRFTDGLHCGEQFVLLRHDFLRIHDRCLADDDTVRPDRELLEVVADNLHRRHIADARARLEHLKSIGIEIDICNIRKAFGRLLILRRAGR